MSNITFIKSGIKKLIPILFVLFITNNLLAQHHEHSDDCSKAFLIESTNYVINHGTSKTFEVKNLSGVPVTWNVVGNVEGQKSGVGNKTEPILFSKPGTYQVIFTSPEMGKNHALTETIAVEVVKNNLTFLINRASLSNTVRSGQSVDGITLTVPVEISSFNNENVKFGPFKNSTTGIDGIDFILDEQIELKPGINNVTFKLQGNAQTAGPAQIGFFDPKGEGYFYNFLISK